MEKAQTAAQVTFNKGENIKVREWEKEPENQKEVPIARPEDCVNVIDADGKIITEFALVRDGKDYVKKADAFATANGYTVDLDSMHIVSAKEREAVDSIAVIDGEGREIAAFSKARDGENFANAAKEFADNNGYFVVGAEKADASKPLETKTTGTATAPGAQAGQGQALAQEKTSDTEASNTTTDELKSFEDLKAIEVAKLTAAQVSAYADKTGLPVSEIEQEVERCKTVLADMGVEL